MTFRAESKATFQNAGMVYVDVHEEGTEATAATAVEAMLEGVPPQPPVFRANPPLLFLIQEDNAGSIRFIGCVTGPMQTEPSASCTRGLEMVLDLMRFFLMNANAKVPSVHPQNDEEKEPTGILESSRLNPWSRVLGHSLYPANIFLFFFFVYVSFLLHPQ